METKKLILVTGGTGNQGGAVARNLVLNRFKVKVLTRDPDSPKARNLKKLDVELVKGDLDNPATYRHHLKHVHGVFSVQTFEKGTKKETEQGMTLADLAKVMGVNHFVYTSVAGAGLNSGIPHFESKRKIEDHIKKLELPYTIIRPVSLYENFLFPQVKKGILKGKLVQPSNRDTVLQYVASDDIGKIAVKIFRDPELYLSKTLTLATESLSTQQVADLFSEELNIPVEYKKLPWVVTRFILGKDIYKMYSWLNKGNLLAQQDEITGKKDFPEMLSLKNWIGMNFKDAAAAKVEPSTLP